MSVDVEAVEAIIAEIRTLPNRGDSPAERAESGGRLILAAIGAGAWSASRYVPMRTMIRQRAEQTWCDGPTSAWSETVWILRGKPKAHRYVQTHFAEDCEFVATALETEVRQVRVIASGGKVASRKKKRGGSKPKYDATQDAKIVRDCEASGLTIKEFATKRNMSFKAIKGAKDRHRKRKH